MGLANDKSDDLCALHPAPAPPLRTEICPLATEYLIGAMALLAFAVIGYTAGAII